MLMFGSYMVQMVRANAHKLDRPLREKVLRLYKPFKWTPCFCTDCLKNAHETQKDVSDY